MAHQNEQKSKLGWSFYIIIQGVVIALAAMNVVGVPVAVATVFAVAAVAATAASGAFDSIASLVASASASGAVLTAFARYSELEIATAATAVFASVCTVAIGAAVLRHETGRAYSTALRGLLLALCPLTTPWYAVRKSS